MAVACAVSVLQAACAPARGARQVYVPSEPTTTSPAGRTVPIQPRPYGQAVDEGDFPRSASEVSGPAVLALLDEARISLDSGRADQAVAALERALRIEPRNPFLWQALAGTHLRQNQPDQAESVAQKSNSLARGNPYVEVQNWRLIAAARQARGDSEGARHAERRIAELEAHLDD